LGERRKKGGEDINKGRERDEKRGRGSGKGGKFGRKVEARGFGREKKGPLYSTPLLAFAHTQYQTRSRPFCFC